MTEGRGSNVPLLTWMALMLIAVVVLVVRLQFSYDLGLFLPQAGTAEQQVLLERLGEAPGTRYIMLAVAAEKGTILDQLTEQLQDDPLFTRVLTDTAVAEADTVPEPIWKHRYLLYPTDFSAAGLALALRQRISDLAVISGASFSEMIRSDPTLTALERLERLAGSTSQQWLTKDGKRLLVAETVAPAFDLDAQHRALGRIDELLADGPPVATERSGVGVFGISLRETIHSEARQRSILASLALASVLLLAYRRWSSLWIAAVPLLSGLLVGLAVIALVFGRIHGITLAFGFTLLGIAIDYPLHLLSHSRSHSPELASQSIWPTLRLGAISTMMAYLAVALSGSEGLAQLGLFTVCGVAAAALATRWVVPRLIGGNGTVVSAGQETAPGLRFSHLLLFLLAAGAGLGVQWQGHLWNNDLSALSPIPKPLLIRDGELRSALGAPDLRHLIVTRDRDLQTLLATTAELDRLLPEAVDQGWLVDFRAVTDLLPDAEIQSRRRDGLPDAKSLRANLATAITGTPFSLTAFEPFIEAVIQARQLQPLQPGDFAGTAFEGLLSQHLYQAGDEWVSVIALFQPQDTEALGRWLSTRMPRASLVDLHRASRTLVRDYRQRTLAVLGLALAAIGLLLLWRTRPRRALWALSVVLASVTTTGALVYTFMGPLNLYHLMALLLVSGLGLDYALFLSRPADPIGRRDSHHAVWACAVSTLAAFGMLALSDIPALQAMGVTVAVGTTLCMTAARCGIVR